MSDHQGIKIGFVLLSSQADAQPSTRISVFNMFPYLTENNIEPVILYEPTKPTETPDVSQVLGKAVELQVDVVYFQKVYGPSVEQLASDLREKGIKTLYGVCDVAKPSMAKLTDATVVVTNFLRTLYPAELQSKIHVVHDGIEHPEFYIKTYQKHCGSREKPLSAVLVTSATMDTLPMIQTIPEWLQVTIVGNYAEGSLLDQLRFHYWNITEKTNWPEKLAYIRFMLNRNITRVKWSPTRVYEELIRADLAIIPIAKYENDDEKFAAPAWKVKSENRLTLKMACGLPVIANPIPAYEEIVRQGENGFLADTVEHWHACLNELRDPDKREKMGLQARKTATARFSREKQAEALINVIRSLV